MALNFPVVLSVLIFATTAHGLFGGDVLDNIKPRNHVEKILQQLRDTINKAVTIGQQELDSAVKKLNDTAAAVKSSTESQIKEIEQELQQKIEKLTEDVKHAAVNFGSCIKDGLNELKNLPGKLVNELVHCITDPITKAVSYAEDANSKAYGLLSVDVSVNIKPSNNAEKLLHQLAETVNKALTTGQQELDDAVKKLNDTAAAVKSRAESQIKEIEQKLQQEIEKLREKS
ncbi:hypothetical protein NQ318_000457 [Aromia moschata]|uniref:Apolipophorin-III n=1 Tax=Aromia moschata TaxID=1265417 RepID=A0AAV8YU77_9CUCU|nr:hypothetical protein NQ318_000457 [Aromia moschata]